MGVLCHRGIHWTCDARSIRLCDRRMAPSPAVAGVCCSVSGTSCNEQQRRVSSPSSRSRHCVSFDRLPMASPSGRMAPHERIDDVRGRGVHGRPVHFFVFERCDPNTTRSRSVDVQQLLAMTRTCGQTASVTLHRCSGPSWWPFRVRAFFHT